MGNETTMVPWDSKGVDYGNKYAGAGERISERTTPVLHVVQTNSPEFEEFRTAKPGDLVIRIGGKDNADNPNIGTSFHGVVVARGIEYLWWGPRGEGGGPIARCVKGNPIPEGCDERDTKWPSEGGTPNKNQKGKDVPKATETRTFIVSILKDGKPQDPMMVTYQSGSAKLGQQLNLALNNFISGPNNAPLFGAIARFYTERIKSKDGEPFYALKFERAGVMPASDTASLDTLLDWHQKLQPMLKPMKR